MNRDTAEIAYPIGANLYLNITNRCSNRCSFCIRDQKRGIGYDLWLQREPTVNEILEAIGRPGRYEEIVFCGYGEPLSRPETVVEVAKALKKMQPIRIRVNTNGQGNLVNRRDIIPELAPVLDSISISLNAENQEKYNQLCQPADPERAFQAILSFAAECRLYIPEVILSVVDIPEISVSACHKLADQLGLPLRVRSFQDK